jgi:hypothetical protein
MRQPAKRGIKNRQVCRSNALNLLVHATGESDRAPGLSPQLCGKQVTPQDDLGAAEREIASRGNHSNSWMLTGRVFGRGHDRDTTPEYWIDGRQHRPLRRRHSGKGRAVPVRCH